MPKFGIPKSSLMLRNNEGSLSTQQSLPSEIFADQILNLKESRAKLLVTYNDFKK